MSGCGPCGASRKPTKQAAITNKSRVAASKKTSAKPRITATRIPAGRASGGGGCGCSKPGGGCGAKKKVPVKSKRSSCYQSRRNDRSCYTDSSDYSSSDSSTGSSDDSYSSDEKCRCRSGCKR